MTTALYIGGAAVERVKSMKLLSVYLTDNLTCSLHTKTKVKSARQWLNFLQRFRKFVLPPQNPDQLLLMYHRHILIRVHDCLVMSWTHHWQQTPSLTGYLPHTISEEGSQNHHRRQSSSTQIIYQTAIRQTTQHSTQTQQAENQFLLASGSWIHCNPVITPSSSLSLMPPLPPLTGHLTDSSETLMDNLFTCFCHFWAYCIFVRALIPLHCC